MSRRERLWLRWYQFRHPLTPDDFDTWTQAEFTTFIRRIGFAASIEASLAEARTEGLLPTDPLTVSPPVDVQAGRRRWWWRRGG